MKSRFLEKGYPPTVVNDAIKRTVALTQDQCLATNPKKPSEIGSYSHNFITTFNKSNKVIRNILSKHWSILCNDPHLKATLPKQPKLTFRRAKTLRNFVAPSKLRPVLPPKKTLSTKPPGCYRCNASRCKNCMSLVKFTDTFCSFVTNNSFYIKNTLDCSSSFVIYLLECPCHLQYIGRTTMPLRTRMNKHRHNVNNGFINHSVSRHALFKHEKNFSCFKLICIEQIPETAQDRFGLLRRREMFWIYCLNTLAPLGLNESLETV